MILNWEGYNQDRYYPLDRFNYLNSDVDEPDAKECDPSWEDCYETWKSIADFLDNQGSTAE